MFFVFLFHEKCLRYYAKYCFNTNLYIHLDIKLEFLNGISSLLLIYKLSHKDINHHDSRQQLIVL